MRLLLTFNDGNPGAGPLTRLLHQLGHAAFHLRLTGHQPVLTDLVYQRRAAAALQAQLGAWSIDAWIPLFEEAWFFAEHPPSVRSLLPDPILARRLHSKRAAVGFNAEHGLPAIPTLVPVSGADPRELLALRGPLLVKEDDSRGGYGTRVVADARALLAEGPLDRLVGCVVQPWWPGDLWILQGVFVDGALIDSEILVKPALWDDRHTVRYRPWHRAVDNPAAQDLLERVGRASGWRGMLEFECLGPPEDLRILEYNPRFSADFLHTVQTGSSFGENTIRAYAGQEPIPRSGPRPGVSRNEGLWTRYLKRQLSARPRALMDPRWLGRWWKLETERRTTTGPSAAFDDRPEGDAALLA